MRMASMPPSGWLRLLCRDWSLENESIVAATDSRFLQYKSYLKGQLTSQLLCRLSISGSEGDVYEVSSPPRSTIDFWKILGVDDEFDRAHIVANIERFCSLYNIRGGTLDESPPSPQADVPTDVNNHNVVMGNNYFPDALHDSATAAAAAAAAAGMGSNNFLFPIDPAAQAVVATAKRPPHATQQTSHPASPHDAFPPGIAAAKLITAKTQTSAAKIHQRRLKAEQRHAEREAYSLRKAAEKAARLASREERRQRKLAMRKRREAMVKAQKDAALQRAAELVRSNRIPIEITRGAAAAQAAANAAVANCAVPAAEAAKELEQQYRAPQQLMMPSKKPVAVAPAKRGRSSIVISTASDLDQIVTHSNNLWAKYNAIAKEHNQKVNWIVVAKELGIHVKVREKYARMHARAKTRGFDFVNWGGYRIKDYPQYFLDPLGPTGTGMEAAASEVAEAEVPARIEEPEKTEAVVAAAALLHQRQQQQLVSLEVPARIEEAVGKGQDSQEVMEASVPHLPQDQQRVPVIPPNPLLQAAEAAFAEAGYSDTQPAVIAPAAADVSAVPHPNPLLQAAEAAFAGVGAEYPDENQPAVIAPVEVQPTEVSGDESQLNEAGNTAV